MNPITAPSQLGTKRYVSGFTHQLYRYPAAAPPDLIREIIRGYSRPNELVLDPFVGGGTTIVEAIAHGRRGLGVDANRLAVFVSRTKTTPLSANSWESLDSWLSGDPLRHPLPAAEADPRSAQLPWRLRRRISAGLTSLSAIDSGDARRMARCCLLRLAQWAIETQFGEERRDYEPTLAHLDRKLDELVSRARAGMGEFTASAAAHGLSKTQIPAMRTVRLSSVWEDFSPALFPRTAGKVNLVLTSPPYPGVHVLYHRWQVRSRRETAAPYWISNTRDGLGPSYYMMGSRSPSGEADYFCRLLVAFRRIRPLMAKNGAVVQLVAFNRPTTQLPLFLNAMQAAGFVLGADMMTREVANRRWYARGLQSGGSQEILLVHHPR